MKFDAKHVGAGVGALVVAALGFWAGKRQSAPAADVGITPEAAAAGAPKQLKVTLPDKTVAALKKKGLPRSALNGNVRDKPWGELVTGLPEGTLVDVLELTTAPEPGGKDRKTWYRISTADKSVTGWMHEDILR